jgi:hypothetical protein
VLLLTPDVQELYDWFYATHELTATGGGLMWHRIALPAPGTVGEQDAKLMERLEHLRTVANQLLWTKKKTGKATAPVTDDTHG